MDATLAPGSVVVHFHAAAGKLTVTGADEEADRLMTTFEERTARAGMSQAEIRKFVGDFTDALVRLALPRLRAVDAAVQNFGSRFDSVAASLDWTNASLLAVAGIDIAWLASTPTPQRTYMHPNFVTDEIKWPFIEDYIAASMVSEKISWVLFPNLKRRPRGVSNTQLLEESRLLNHYLHLAHEAGFSGDRVIAYQGDLGTHSQQSAKFILRVD